MDINLPMSNVNGYKTHGLNRREEEDEVGNPATDVCSILSYIDMNKDWVDKFVH